MRQLITGANRGIGRALVEEALRRGAKTVHAGTRGPLRHPDNRVTPLTLDVTSVSDIQRAVSEIDSLDRVTVHAVVLGPIDTDMNRGFEIPKASPEATAVGIFDGLERGEDEIFPDPASQSIAEGWRTGALKAMERQFAAFAPKSARKIA